MHDRGLRFFVDLESRVWDALASGDVDADRNLLSDDFVGVSPTGFANRADHTGELTDGPTVASFTITDARLIDVSADSVMLCYRAVYQRLNESAGDVMFVSSLWVNRGGRWWNTFSQDTPAGPATVQSPPAGGCAEGSRCGLVLDPDPYSSTARRGHLMGGPDPW